MGGRWGAAGPEHSLPGALQSSLQNAWAPLHPPQLSCLRLLPSPLLSRQVLGGACHHLTLGSSLARTCSHSVPSLASKSLSLPTPASETDLSLGLGLLETGSLPFLGCAMASGRTQPLVPDQSLPRAGGPACR